MLKSSGTWIAALMVVALGTVGSAIFLTLRPSTPDRSAPSFPTAATSSQPASGTVTVLGHLEPIGEIVRVAPPSTVGTARVIKLLVRQGETVKAGQVIAVMDSYDRLRAAAIQAQAQVIEAQARMNQVRAGTKREDIDAQQSTIARLEAEQQTADREYQRYQVLYANGAVSAAELNNRQLAVKTAALQLEQARKMLDSVSAVRPADVQQAEAQLQVTLANLERAKAELETALVRSPIPGQVVKIHAQEGEQVGSQLASNSSASRQSASNQGSDRASSLTEQPGCNCVAEVGKISQMYAIAEVPQTDIAKVRQGQKATITSTAFPGTLSGTVEQIGLQSHTTDALSPTPASTEAATVEVKVRLDDSRRVIGMTNLPVQVEITL